MGEETWHQARLIPTSGINGADEQERRATSALLAVMSSVREFGRVLTQPLGAPAGPLETYIEVPFQLGERRLYPEGLVRARRGQKQWTALVEVKTGVNELSAEQLEAYLDIAREQDFDAVITISNEIPPIAGLHPTRVDKRKLQFDDMGASWVTTREAVAAGTLRSGDKCAPEVAARFDALLRYVSLQLGRKLGDDVTPALSRKELAEPSLRSHASLSPCARTEPCRGRSTSRTPSVRWW